MSIGKEGVEAIDQWLAIAAPGVGRQLQPTGLAIGTEKFADKPALKTEGDSGVLVTRRFAAPPAAVYQAHIDPALIQQWMLGPDGWSMPVCICEAKPTGKIRYEWSNGRGGGFYLTGEFLELDPPRRIVHVERMHLPDATPDNRIETHDSILTANGTLMTMRMTLPDLGNPDADVGKRYGTGDGGKLSAPGAQSRLERLNFRKSAQST